MFEWRDNKIDSDDTTTIEISVNTYMNLQSARFPSSSFDDTLERLLKRLSKYEKSDCEPIGTTEQLSIDPSYNPDDVETAVREVLSKSSFEPAKVEAMKEVVNFLSKHGTVGKKEFFANTYETNEANYDSKESWWENFVRPTLDEFTHAKKPDRGGKWEYLSEKE